MHLATRVPLTMRVPDVKLGSRHVLVETSDLFATLCETVGLEEPKTMPGKSFGSIHKDPFASFRWAAMELGSP